MSDDKDRETSWELAQAIAPHLPGWRPCAPKAEWAMATLRRDSDGASILVRVGGWQRQGRVEFAGQAPLYRNGQARWFDRRHMAYLKDERTFEITCRVDRKPEAMAKEIARRLLAGGYDSLWAEYSEAVRVSDAHDVDAEAVADRLALALGGQTERSKSRSDGSVHVLGTPEAVSRLRVFAGYDSSLGGRPTRVDFEVHGLDPETAARVLDVIQEAERAQAEVPEGARVAESGPVRVAVEAEPEEDAVDEDGEVRRTATPMS